MSQKPLYHVVALSRGYIIVSCPALRLQTRHHGHSNNDEINKDIFGIEINTFHYNILGNAGVQ